MKKILISILQGGSEDWEDRSSSNGLLRCKADLVDEAGGEPEQLGLSGRVAFLQTPPFSLEEGQRDFSNGHRMWASMSPELSR